MAPVVCRNSVLRRSTMVRNKCCLRPERMRNGKTFSDWVGIPDLNLEGKNFFSSADFMGSFFEYDYERSMPRIDEAVMYVANYKAIVPEEIIHN